MAKAIKAKFNRKEPIEFKIYKARNKVKDGILFYIEAQQKYNYSDDYDHNLDCFSSWVLINADKITFLYSDFNETNYYGKEKNDIVPNIVILERGKYYIISENYGYEWEFYTIHQILDNDLKEVLLVRGGGC